MYQAFKLSSMGGWGHRCTDVEFIMLSSIVTAFEIEFINKVDVVGFVRCSHSNHSVVAVHSLTSTSMLLPVTSTHFSYWNVSCYFEYVDVHGYANKSVVGS